MDATGFDPTRLAHWLLISCFVGVSIWGLLLSWGWRQEAQMKRRRSKLARRLAMELHGVNRHGVSRSLRKGSPAPSKRMVIPSDE